MQAAAPARCSHDALRQLDDCKGRLDADAEAPWTQPGVVSAAEASAQSRSAQVVRHHLPPVTTCHLPPVTTCHHLPPPATTCHHLPPPATACHHLPPATTCRAHSVPARAERAACMCRQREDAEEVEMWHALGGLVNLASKVILMQTPWEAVCDGGVACIRDLIQCTSVTANSADWIGLSPLDAAATRGHLNALKGISLSEAQQLSHLCDVFSTSLLHVPAVEVVPYITPFYRGTGLTYSQRYRTRSPSPSNVSLRLRGGADDMSQFLLNRILVAAVELIGESECSLFELNI